MDLEGKVEDWKGGLVVHEVLENESSVVVADIILVLVKPARDEATEGVDVGPV